jgi:hypothetical protein
MPYRLLILFLALVSLVLMAGPVAAQEMTDVPTWAVGYNWSYNETGSYRLADGRAEISFTENYTWRVNEVTADTYVLGKSGTITGTVRVSVPPISLDAEVRNGRTEGRMVVRRSNLGIVEETQTRTVTLVRFIELGTVTLRFTLRDSPTIKTYNFPLQDGNSFFANVTKSADYRLSGSILGIDVTTLVRPGSESLALSLTSATAAEDGNYHVMATADEYDASITDLYDPSLKNFREEEWSIQVPGLGMITQNKTLAGTPNVPNSPARLTITGDDSGSQFVSTGESVTLSGTGWPANSTVVVRQPETPGAQWSATTDANGAFSTSFTVQDGMFRDSVMSDYVANVGLVAESGTNAAVTTLVVAQ